jgi:DNA-binding CsgD family transcriptional regulator
VKDKQLMVGNREENRRFKEMVDTILAIQSKGGLPDVSALRIETPHSVSGLGLLCRAMPPTATPDAGASVALFISDPEKPRLSKVTVLEQLFGLTLSEAKLALLLANGYSLDEASEELNITRNTAKSHLSSTFSKTGVTRQPSLVQLILRSVASIG